jgi:hypothetical protein
MVSQIYKILHKKQWVKRVLIVLAFLFVFQSYPPLCGACFIGECGSEVEVKTSSSRIDCHGSASVKPCHSKKSDTVPQSSGSHEDSCPSCSCIISGDVDASEKTVPTSSGHLPQFIVFEVSEIMDHDMVRRDISILDPPEKQARSHPIFIINSSFLI